VSKVKLSTTVAYPPHRRRRENRSRTALLLAVREVDYDHPSGRGEGMAWERSEPPELSLEAQRTIARTRPNERSIAVVQIV
jgi:hypothetical protein